ncbi:hypothetical protein BN946_scf184911.g78 [Trametes cinnabarina]|uniref:Uncharacterized protein n=1 Tax=Pycnoporus cinnabarinus TaxID=5643 RepID=A0A060SGQ7_PYCCI|nr:hypothetical protein BN946_scf184911.g78 [Trametes cinnabarina]
MGTDKKDSFATELDTAGPSASSPRAGPSIDGSPGRHVEDPFSDAVAHDVAQQPPPPKYTEHAMENLYIPMGGEEPPPNFTPYEAEFFISNGEIISHDPHLNRDGEALYRFLLSQTATRPEYFIHMKGTHTEHKTRTVYRKDQQGNLRPHDEHYTETVTDFDFRIDIGEQIVHGPIHWTVPDAEPAYRGKMYLEVDSNQLLIGDTEASLQLGRRKATKDEIKAAKQRKQLREDHGIPPWVVPAPDEWYDSTSVSPPPDAQVLGSSMSMRDWADEYCASDKLLKEFTYEMVVYGWNIANLKEAITSAIRSVYSSKITVEFEMSHHKIRIRPDNHLSRALSNKWIKFLLWILLIYPFIWLYKRFGRRGGGRWEVCGGACALKTWRQPIAATPPPPEARNDGRWKETPDGLLHLVGEREGEWFQRWEGPIRNAVLRKVQSRTPLEFVNNDARTLDGYRPTFVQPRMF